MLPCLIPHVLTCDFQQVAGMRSSVMGFSETTDSLNKEADLLLLPWYLVACVDKGHLSL